MGTVDPIKIEGLTEFVRSLRKLDSDLPKALRVSFNTAADLVVDYARPRVPSRSGKARRSVKARSTREAVRVVGGSRTVPYYPWLDFGGTVGKGKSVRRPFIKEGRYIYAGYFARRAQVEEGMVEALLDVARQAGVDVEHG
jgi:hypothetical protein